MSAREGDRAVGLANAHALWGWVMIGVVVAAALVIQQPWPKAFGTIPQFGAQAAVNTAYYCHISGTFDAQGHFTKGPTARPISVLVSAGALGAPEPVRTADPTMLLGGRQFTVFREIAVPKAYAALTSLGSPVDPNPLIMTLQPLKSSDGYAAVLSPLKGPNKQEELAGACHSSIGVTVEQFDRLAKALRQ